MTTDKGILIYNVFYMLSYAFQDLRKNNYEDIDKEDFDNIQDLLSEILFRGVSAQLKHGLYREYVERADSLPTLKGHINMPETIKHRINRKALLHCEFDELSVNNQLNQILRCTIQMLVNEPSVKAQHRAQLRNILPFFADVDFIAPSSIKWSTLTFQRNNRSYKMLMNVCFFIIDGMLLTTSEGSYRMTTFSDEHMERLYEKFILEYYKRHHPELKPESRYLDWNLDEEKTANKALLPAMHSDIFLQHGDRILIIDAKYYRHMTAENFGKPKVHTANLYQIHTYVSTTDIEHTGNVAGMLLYAKAEGEEEPHLDITQKDGVRIMARTLNLALPFVGIREQLEDISRLLSTP